MGVTKVSKTAELKEFKLNPYNVRDLSTITIKRAANTEDGDVAFELDPELGCSPDYRKKFNEFLNSLVQFEGVKAIYRATMPFKTTSKVRPIGGDETAPTVRYVKEGNTRFYILCQLIEALGEENVTFGFSYFIQDERPNNEELSLIAELIVAPESGTNESVPVLADSSLQAGRLLEVALAQFGELTRALDYVGTKLVDSGYKSKGWFSWFSTVSYFADYISDDAKTGLNLEYRAKYARYVVSRAGYPNYYRFSDGLESDKINPVLELVEFGKFQEQTGTVNPITTKSKWEIYTNWADKQQAVTVPTEGVTVEESESESAGAETGVDVADVIADIRYSTGAMKGLDEDELDAVNKGLSKILLKTLNALNDTPEVAGQFWELLAKALESNQDRLTGDTIKTVAKSLNPVLKIVAPPK